MQTFLPKGIKAASEEIWEGELLFLSIKYARAISWDKSKQSTRSRMSWKQSFDANPWWPFLIATALSVSCIDTPKIIRLVEAIISRWTWTLCFILLTLVVFGVNGGIEMIFSCGRTTSICVCCVGIIVQVIISVRKRKTVCSVCKSIFGRFVSTKFSRHETADFESWLFYCLTHPWNWDNKSWRRMGDNLWKNSLKTTVM